MRVETLSVSHIIFETLQDIFGLSTQIGSKGLNEPTSCRFRVIVGGVVRIIIGEPELQGTFCNLFRRET